jgi:asparagine N-glycosylation enzyme membrane subunit Stt3
MEKKILNYPLRVALAIFLAGTLFKIMHWPGSNVLIVVAAGLVAILYTIRFASKKDKNATAIVKFTWVLVASFSYPAKILHWPSLKYLHLIVSIGAIYWLYEEWQGLIKNGQNKNARTFNKSLINTAILITVLGFLIKIMHWPMADMFIIIGYTLLIIWLLTGSLYKKREVLLKNDTFLNN